ncbi:MAG: hypothetical protein WAW24_02290, partial [Bacteroidales bacterium]
NKCTKSTLNSGRLLCRDTIIMVRSLIKKHHSSAQWGFKTVTGGKYHPEWACLNFPASAEQ